MCNDHIYWDTEGLKYTHVPPPDDGGGNALWWPCVNEWVSYEFSISSAGSYRIPIRFATGWGPDKPVYIHITIDGIGSGSFILEPDDPIFWHDTYYQTGGWWGHTMVNGICPYTWSLSRGKHILKVIVDDFPSYQGVDQDAVHSWLWIHYFKIMYVGPPDGKWVSIIKPLKDTSFIAPANISLGVLTEAGDSAIVNRVAFFNGLEKIGEALEKPYSFEWNGVKKGIYDITAMMIDSKMDTTVSEPIRITVLASIPPRVNITEPFNNSVFPENTNVIINAQANDPDGTIAKVSFFNGETKLGECLNAPYHFEWTNLSPGKYSITAVAIDNTETSTTSLPVNFTMGDCNSGTNLILNPEFDDLTSTWKTWNDGGSAFSKSVVNNAGLSGNNALMVDISNASGPMGIRLWTNLDFKNGHDYRICFMAKSTVTKQVKIAFKERGLNGTEYWSHNISIDALSTSYGPYFYHCDHEYPNGELDFYLGANAGTIWLDKVKVADQNLTGILSQQLNKVQIYPNYVTGEFLHITADELIGETVSLTIYNQNGQKVFNKSVCYSGPIQIPVSQLSGNGIYPVTIQTEKETYTQKIIVSNLKLFTNILIGQ